MQRELSLDEIKSIQLDILSQVANYCDRNGLCYFLAYGTLLGAVRHKGYIPWDDDIDIMMPRPDYMQFINSFNNEESVLRVGSHYLDKNYPYVIAKVYNTSTLCKENIDVEYSIGINIDVFPIDGLPETEREFSRFYCRLNLLRKIFLFKTITMSKNRSISKNILLTVGKCLLVWTSLKKIITKMNVFASRIDYNSADFVGIVVFGDGVQERISSSVFKEKIRLEFEGKYFYVPQGYDSWLKNIYGDYMQLPPEDKRVTHHDFKAYRID